jgi:hypothetical protein
MRGRAGHWVRRELGLLPAQWRGFGGGRLCYLVLLFGFGAVLSRFKGLGCYTLLPPRNILVAFGSHTYWYGQLSSTF